MDSVNRQVVPEIYDTFSKNVTYNGAITEVFENLIRVPSRAVCFI